MVDRCLYFLMVEHLKQNYICTPEIPPVARLVIEQNLIKQSAYKNHQNHPLTPHLIDIIKLNSSRYIKDPTRIRYE